MFASYDWDKLSDQDKAFKCGYLVSKYQSAISDLAISVVIISDESVSEGIKVMIWARSDSALLTAANIDFKKFIHIEGYQAMAPFLPDKSMIKNYIELRTRMGHVSFDDNIESLLQDAIRKIQQ